MQALAHALNQISKDSKLGKMVDECKQTEIKTTQTCVSIYSKKEVYERNLKQTLTSGVGSLYPCSLLAWKPGMPMKSKGITGRIKWGLSDGNTEFVVVVFDSTQPLYGTNFKSEVSIVAVSSLSPCDCNGYVHNKHCKPCVSRE